MDDMVFPEQDEVVVTPKMRLAVIDAIERQFREELCPIFFEYNPALGLDGIIKTGDLDTCMDMHTHCKILEGLAAEHSGIEIDIAWNYFDAEHKYYIDGLHNSLCLSDNPTKLEKEAYEVRGLFGTIYIRTTPKGIKMAREYLVKKYKAIIEFDPDFVNYKIRCFPGDEVYNFHFHDGRLPQRIIQYAVNHEGECITSKRLQEELGLGASMKRKIGSQIFSRDRQLQYFFKLESNAITFNGFEAEGLTRKDIIDIRRSQNNR